jgi:transcriptional regulator GlxA family with amidase domain
MIAKRWGFREPGRFSGWYKNLFGEAPSQTRLRSQALRNAEMLL